MPACVRSIWTNMSVLPPTTSTATPILWTKICSAVWISTKKNTFLPCGTAPDEQKECDRYNALLKTLDRDIQILGIGSNGHIAFNEPGTPFDSETHVVNLTENTIKDNSRLFDSIDRVPKKAYSMGIKNILDAKKIVVMASGEHKAKAVYDMLNADISVACPATALRTHGDVTLIADEGAAQLLK